MKKVIRLFLALCLFFSGALCYAHGVAGTEKGKGAGTPIGKEKNNGNGSDKGNSINPILNGKVLFVAFTENLGEVAVDVLAASGSPVQGLSVLTPNGLQVYVPLAGDYIVNFTLPDGDGY